MRIERIVRACLHPVTEYRVQVAKRKHRKANPHCAVCGYGPKVEGKTVEVHHILPVHAAPELAATDSNLVTLCRLHHLWVGHCGNFKTWNSHVRLTADAMIGVFERSATVARVIETDQETGEQIIEVMPYRTDTEEGDGQ